MQSISNARYEIDGKRRSCVESLVDAPIQRLLPLQLTPTSLAVSDMTLDCELSIVSEFAVKKEVQQVAHLLAISMDLVFAILCHNSVTVSFFLPKIVISDLGGRVPTLISVFPVRERGET